MGEMAETLAMASQVSLETEAATEMVTTPVMVSQEPEMATATVAILATALVPVLTMAMETAMVLATELELAAALVPVPTTATVTAMDPTSTLDQMSTKTCPASPRALRAAP